MKRIRLLNLKRAKVLFFGFLLLQAIIVACQNNNKSLPVGEDEFPIGSMIEVGIDSTTINRIDTAVANGTFPNIHSLLIAKNNSLVYEKYWRGKDQKWGEDLGLRMHSKDSLHDIRSITKSIVSACMGIAIKQGKIKNVRQKVFEYFPEYAKYNTGLKEQLTLEHLLTMTAGIKWNEEIPYSNPENSEIQMMLSGKPAEYVLSQPMELTPGTKWKYNGGATQVLAAIIKKATGEDVAEFANKNLFQFLGIKSFEWIKYPGTDEYAAASGLRLRSRDLLKFGLLYMNEGKWNGKEIVPPDWVKTSVEPHATIDANVNGYTTAYGYHFWLFTDSVMNKPVHFAACVGNGDQRILMDKTRDLVIVATAGNYNAWNIQNTATQLVRRYIYPALKSEF